MPGLRVLQLPPQLPPRQRACLTALLRLCFPRSQATAQARPGKLWWVVLCGTRLVAAANVERGVLWDLCVHPACRRRGLGGALLRHVLRRRGRRALRLFIDTWDNHAFYRKRGFVVESSPPDHIVFPAGAVACMVRRNTEHNLPEYDKL